MFLAAIASHCIALGDPDLWNITLDTWPMVPAPAGWDNG